MIEGKLLDNDEERLTLRALLLENVGAYSGRRHHSLSAALSQPYREISSVSTV